MKGQLNIVDFTCTRANTPSCSNHKVIRHHFSPRLIQMQFLLHRPQHNCNSAHSPRNFGCLMFIPRFFIRHQSLSTTPGFPEIVAQIKTRPARAAPVFTTILTMAHSEHEGNPPQKIKLPKFPFWETHPTHVWTAAIGCPAARPNRAANQREKAKKTLAVGRNTKSPSSRPAPRRQIHPSSPRQGVGVTRSGEEIRSTPEKT